MPWTLHDPITYQPNFSSRIVPHGANAFLWVSNNSPGPNYVIQYDPLAKIETPISLDIDGVNFDGSPASTMSVNSDGTNIFAKSNPSARLPGGGYDHPVWDHSTGTNWSEVDDLDPNTGQYQTRIYHFDGTWYIPRAWASSGNNNLVYTSSDALTWVGELASVTSQAAFSGRFLNTAVPVIAKTPLGMFCAGLTSNNFTWQWYKRVGVSWQPSGITINGYDFQGVDMVPIGPSEQFNRLYRQRLTGNRALQYSEDGGATWNDCVTDNDELVVATEMGGVKVVYAHSGREFISFNREITPTNHFYSLYEFNDVTKKFDYIDDMPNDSNSFQGAFVYSNELYIYQSGNIYKHDSLSFGEVTASEFDLRIIPGSYQGDLMAVSGDGTKLSIVTEVDGSPSDMKVYQMDMATFEFEVIFTDDNHGIASVHEFPTERKFMILGFFDNKNVKLYDIDLDTITDISEGSSTMMVGRISYSGKILAHRSNGQLFEYANGVWSSLGASNLFNTGQFGLDAIFFDGWLDDYVFVIGWDDQGDTQLRYSPNNMSSTIALQNNDFPITGEPEFTGLALGFDG